MAQATHPERTCPQGPGAGLPLARVCRWVKGGGGLFSWSLVRTASDPDHSCLWEGAVPHAPPRPPIPAHRPQPQVKPEAQLSHPSPKDVFLVPPMSCRNRGTWRRGTQVFPLPTSWGRAIRQATLPTQVLRRNGNRSLYVMPYPCALPAQGEACVTQLSSLCAHPSSCTRHGAGRGRLPGFRPPGLLPDLQKGELQ